MAKDSRSRLSARVLLALGAAFATFFLAPGCADRALPLGADPLVEQLVALGFRRDMIQDRGSYFQVEGDISISKDAVPRLAAAPPVRTLDVLRFGAPGHGKLQKNPLGPEFQWSTNALVGQAQVQDIVVDLSGLASLPDWQAAARGAIVQWNSITCSVVHMVEGTPGDITFSTHTDVPYHAVTATFPADAPAGSHKPGPTIKVNTLYTGSPNNAGTKLFSMVHEIGHTLGFRHTDWWWYPPEEDPYGYGANLIPGTDSSDLASVMNRGTATNEWAGFSPFDIAATDSLYPRHCVFTGIDGPTWINTYGTYTWTAPTHGGVLPYSYAWEINYVNYPGWGPIGGNSNSVTFDVDPNGGDQQLRVTVTAANGQTAVGNIYTVVSGGSGCETQFICAPKARPSPTRPPGGTSTAHRLRTHVGGQRR